MFTKTTSQNEQVERVYHTITTVRRFVLAITALTMIASYQHQVHVFAAQGAGWVSWILPAPLDLLVLALMKVAQLPVIPASSRWIARFLLLFPASGSAYINFVGAGSTLLRCTYAGLILGIVIGDFTVSLIKVTAEAVNEVAAAAGPSSAAEHIAAQQAAAAKAAKSARKCEPGCTCGKHRPAKKAAAAKPRTRRPAATPKLPAATRPVLTAAPVAGTTASGIWVVKSMADVRS